MTERKPITADLRRWWELHCRALATPELDGTERPALDLDGALSVSVTGDGWYAVRCGDCCAMGPRVRATRAKGCGKALDAWNRRTIWAQ